MLYGHHPDSVPLNECVAWRVASCVGGVVASIVAPCVMRSISGTAGSLSARRVGFPRAPEPFAAVPAQCRAAAFFDSLIAQQGRHVGNYRWDPAARLLGLIDHGFAFAGMRFNPPALWRGGTRRTLLRSMSGRLRRLICFCIPTTCTVWRLC